MRTFPTNPAITYWGLLPACGRVIVFSWKGGGVILGVGYMVCVYTDFSTSREKRGESGKH